MADRSNRRKRWDLGLKPHSRSREELSSITISKRLESPEERNNEDKKEKRKRSRIQNQKKNKNKNKMDNNNNNGEDGGHSLNDDIVVSHILSRLPAKSLMRCKLVCKDWKLIIEHDLNFINLHHKHSKLRPSLFIAARPSCRSINNQGVKRWQNFESSFFSADLHFDDDDDDDLKCIAGATIHCVPRGLKSLNKVVKYLGPVRGLLCLVDSFFSVQIYNVSTGQATPWISSAVTMKWKHEGQPRCQFGFDPNTGKHKVVHLWHLNYKQLSYYLVEESYTEAPVCEVLTVGDTRWRIINDVPPCEIRRDYSAYANGSIYWIAYSESGRGRAEYSESLVAFDIGSEKFRMISIPNFTLWGEYPFPCLGLIEMDGCITVIRLKSLHSDEVRLWKFYDHEKENGTSATIGSSSGKKEVWTEVDIILPPHMKSCWDIIFHPISGKDEMILLEVYRLNLMLERNLSTPPPMVEKIGCPVASKLALKLQLSQHQQGKRIAVGK
ncbi:F-box protein At4g19940 [Linum perenne]